MMELTFDKCCICGKTFAGYAGLSKHIPQAHPGISNQEYYDKYYKKPGEGICPVCGKPTQFSGRLNRGYYEHCSKQCTALDKKVDEKRRATKKELYGDECFNNHVKTTQTKIDRYGDANYANGDQIRATKLERYGQAGYNNPEKRKQTKLEKYGASNYVNKEKAADTKEKRYGDKYFNNSQKTFETKLKRYGIKNYVNPNKARQTVNTRTKEKYEKLVSDQCDILNYKTGLFYCRCKTCNNDFTISMSLAHARLAIFGIKWCTNCLPAETSRSAVEDALCNYVATLVGKDNIVTSCRDVVQWNELDIYIPSRKLAVEFNGLYWHSEQKKSNNYHKDKTNACEQQNIRLIQVFEDEWNYKKDIVKSRIASILGKNLCIGARSCTLTEVSKEDADAFLMENHIEGPCESSHRYGLVYDGVLVAVMTFTYVEKTGEMYLSRFCSKLYMNIVGGASRLFKAFVRSHSEIERVVTFVDRRWSKKESLYLVLGFVYDSTMEPKFCYTYNNHRISAKAISKEKLVAIGYDGSVSVHEFLNSKGRFRIYDSGWHKYIWSRH